MRRWVDFFAVLLLAVFPGSRTKITNEGGIYKVYYNVSDAAGNKEKGRIRMVIVEIF
ncbi:MAG: hypothetical protein IEMM0006_0612 [bacterium]|nr:MAG: hypothetical protein IEMM0006_0612 [bacterium]